MIIDCHVHLSTFSYEGLSFSQICDNLVSSMQEHGINHSFIYPDCEPDTGVSDLDITVELVRRHPKLFMLGTASIPVIDSEIIDKLDTLASTGDIIGVKLYPGFELFYPDEDRCHAIYQLCTKHDIPVVFHSGETMNEPWREEYNHPFEIAKVATRFPSLKLIVAHFSQPHIADCRDVILKNPNVYADISGLAHPDVTRICGKDAILSVLEDVATQQPEKILFGTDWPICSVGEHLKLVNSLTVSEKVKTLILSGNAERVFALELDLGASLKGR